MKDNKCINGFTLIEVLAVLVIIGIIAIIVIPNVSGYINDTRNSAYHAHEKTMEESAKSMTVECIAGREECNLPKESNTVEIYLNELEDKKFISRLQDPGGTGYCSENLSYVRVTNTGDGNYEYNACLYCQNYHTDDPDCAVIENPTGDNTPPVCGTVTGDSSQWTKGSRTITVECSDSGVGCLRDKFTRTFSATQDEAFIEIVDKAGNIKQCSVSVKVDNTVPTCELEVESIDLDGTAVVKFASKEDSNSGLDIFGIGKSITPNYNNESRITISSGITTVIGYVKDNAGNHGICTKTVDTTIVDPDFSILYGYQIYPNKEIPSIDTTNNTITFNANINKYTNVRRAIIEFDRTISNATAYKLAE